MSPEAPLHEGRGLGTEAVRGGWRGVSTSSPPRRKVGVPIQLDDHIFGSPATA